MKYILINIFCFSIINVFAQKTVEAYGEFPLSDNISFNQATEEALIEAKKEALRKAGISEQIYSTQILTSSSKNDKLDENFIEDVFLNIGGTIKSWEYVQKPYKKHKDGMDFVSITIKAKIKKYNSKPDPMLNARIEGILPSYKSNVSGKSENNIHINITPSIDCYLKIFYVSESQTAMMYPIEAINKENEIEIFKDKKLIQNESRKIDYISPFTEKENENGRLFFILTKQPYPYPYAKEDEDGYYTLTYFDKITNWYNSIEPNEKNILSKPFSVSR